MSFSSKPLRSTKIPPIARPCPVVYFDALCTEISAPCSKGRQRTGVATVLSTTVKIPCLFAMVVIASISATSILGFVKDSKNITFVFASTSFSISSGL